MPLPCLMMWITAMHRPGLFPVSLVSAAGHSEVAFWLRSLRPWLLTLRNEAATSLREGLKQFAFLKPAKRMMFVCDFPTLAVAVGNGVWTTSHSMTLHRPPPRP